MALPQQGYTGPYGNMQGYFLGAGGALGMPSGSNNQNAFIAGIAGQYLAGGSLSRRGVAVYSNLSSTVGANFTTRLNVPGVVASPAWVGPMPAFFPVRNGKIFNGATQPY
jgi:hypothetical protein